jgi:ribosome-associated protein
MKRNPIEVIHFTLTQETIDLHQLLKATGVAESGGEGKNLVANRQVMVDGAIELRKSAKIRAGQLIKLPGVTICVHAPEA